MKTKKHILIVDDVTTNLKCLGELLRSSYSLSMAKSGEQALQMAQKVRPDLVVLDLKMPGMDGYETFEKLKEYPHLKEIPVIFLTADTETCSELKSLKLGASDFIRKPYEPDVMIERIERVLNQEEKNRAIRDSAMKDPLTGLWNRRYIQNEIDNIDNVETTGTFMILDLDNFKGINDTYGHVVGDSALIAFAKTLSQFVHSDDIVARIGGDEFAVFLKNCYGKELLEDRVNGLIRQVEKELRIIKKDDSISSVSIGLSAFPFDGKNFIELYNNADKALYYVKRNGKSGCHFYASDEKYSFAEEAGEEVIDLSQLRGFIEEKDIVDGPFDVDYSNFKNLYQFLKRYALRTHSNIQLLMFTLKDLALADGEKKTDLVKSMNILSDCIKDSLRKNDVSAKYTNSQYLVILMDCDEVNRQIVVSRILDNWNENNENLTVLLKYDIEELCSEVNEE